MDWWVWVVIIVSAVFILGIFGRGYDQREKDDRKKVKKEYYKAKTEYYKAKTEYYKDKKDRLG